MCVRETDGKLAHCENKRHSVCSNLLSFWMRKLGEHLDSPQTSRANPVKWQSTHNKSLLQPYFHSVTSCVGESQRTHECVMAHTWLRHVTYVDELRHTHKQVMAPAKSSMRWSFACATIFCVCVCVCVCVCFIVCVYQCVFISVCVVCVRVCFCLRDHFCVRV